MIYRRTDKIKSIFYFLDLRPNNEVFIVKIDIQGFECKVGNLTVKFLKNRIVSVNYVHVIPYILQANFVHDDIPVLYIFISGIIQKA